MPFDTRVLLMVCDGLRPDFVTPAGTPRLAALAATGVEFRNSRAVFPTVTRANSASLATGVFPRAHGIPGNEMVADAVLPGERFTTADADRLERLRAVRGGRVLLVDTLADRVAAAGGRTAVVGTGSPGAALLQNPQGHLRADALLHPSRFLGWSRAAIEQAQGPVPPRTVPNTAQNTYFTRLICEALLPAGRHDLIVFWHTDPDHTQHAHGLGHPLAARAIADADRNLGLILDAIAERAAAERWLVVVTSDHGFSTVEPRLGHPQVGPALVERGLKASAQSADVIPVDGGVYVRQGGADRCAAIVELLRGMRGIGPLFSGGGGMPVVPGTIGREAVGQGGPLAPEVQYSLRWSDGTNGRGVAGLCADQGHRLRGAHGSLSRYELANTLIMAGPGIKRAVVSRAPAGVVDVAPTLARLLDTPWHGPCDGRVLEEALEGGPHPTDIAVRRDEVRASTDGVTQVVRRSWVADTMYLDEGVVLPDAAPHQHEVSSTG